MNPPLALIAAEIERLRAENERLTWMLRESVTRGLIATAKAKYSVGGLVSYDVGTPPDKAVAACIADLAAHYQEHKQTPAADPGGG